MLQVTIYQQVYRHPANQHLQREDWSLRRKRSTSFTFANPTPAWSCERAAEEAFHITNAPDELLSEEQLEHREAHLPRPSLSVGDVAEVSDKNGTILLLCKSNGWGTPNPIEECAFLQSIVVEPNPQGWGVVEI
jgi:hypothetical protein